MPFANLLQFLMRLFLGSLKNSLYVDLYCYLMSRGDIGFPSCKVSARALIVCTEDVYTILERLWDGSYRTSGLFFIAKLQSGFGRKE